MKHLFNNMDKKEKQIILEMHSSKNIIKEQQSSNISLCGKKGLEMARQFLAREPQINIQVDSKNPEYVIITPPKNSGFTNGCACKRNEILRLN